MLLTICLLQFKIFCTVHDVCIIFLLFLAFVNSESPINHQCSNALRLAVNVHPKLPRPFHGHTQHTQSYPTEEVKVIDQRSTASTTTASKPSTFKSTKPSFKPTEKPNLVERLTKECKSSL